jgi:hypothetical protein
LIVIRDGCVVETYKGLPDETNNALLATYSLHAQKTNIPVTQAAVRNVPLKVVRTIRVALSHLSRSSHRNDVKAALSSNNTFQRIECLANIDFTALELSADSKKTLAFQMAQTVALINGEELYTKAAVKEAFPQCADLIDRAGGSSQHLNSLRNELVEQLRGVYVRQKGDLNLFMYGNALAIDDWNQFARQSRGMIVDVKRERCVSFPMDKFFRFGEGPELGREAISLDTPVEVVEKSDGSMVSLIWHDRKIGFSCKGNFDTVQSNRAEEIAQRLPITELQLDRFYHVFEVIYPENRYPSGLSVVDYGDRADLVLTAMRDRATNRLLSYAEVVAEAQRVGLSHPACYQLDLAGAFNEVDKAPLELGTEGFVIRTVDDGRYFKLKYPAYKKVLKIVNDLRSDRFVRRYFDSLKEERASMLAILPDDIRTVALAQLDKHAQISARLESYVDSVTQAGPAEDRRAFAKYVNTQVPEPLRKLVFQANRGGDTMKTVEKLATDVYVEEICIPHNHRTIAASNADKHSTADEHEDTMMMEQKGNRSDQKTQGRGERSIDEVARALWDTIPLMMDCDFDGIKECVYSELDGVEDPTEVFRRYLNIFEAECPGGGDWRQDPELRDQRAGVIFLVAEIGHPGLLPLIEELLQSELACERAKGAMALRFYDEERAIDEIATVYTELAEGSLPRGAVVPLHLIFELNTIGTPNALGTMERLRDLKWNHG